MKAGWEVKTLGEVCDVFGGGTPPKDQPHFYGGDIPWATVRDMNVETLEQTEHSITESGLSASSSKLVPAGEVIMASRVGLGKICMLAQDTAINQDLRGLIPKRKGELDRRFLFHWLKSIAQDIIDAGSGATVQGVKLPFIKGLQIPLPPLDEQKRIVEVLDAAFEGLSRARAHTETNLQNARELFESGLLEVFGNLNDPEHQKLLREVSVEFGRGKSKHRPRNDKALYDGAYPFIQTGDVRNSRHIIDTYSQTYNDFGLAQSKLWPAGTVCITIAANIAETGVLGFDACFPDSVIGMVPDVAKTNSTYVEYLLQFFQKRLKALGEGSAQQNINLATFETEYFPFPALAIQEDAIERLSRLSATVADLESHYRAKLADLDALRQALLQKAFAGELT